MTLVRRCLPRDTACAAATFVLVVLWTGLTFGYREGLPHCSTTAVSAGSVFAQNLVLSLALASGVFSLGLSTLAVGAWVLGMTGAAVGAIVSRFGLQAVALLAPHGLLELTAWIIGVGVGLEPLLARWRGRTMREARSLLVSGGVIAVLLAIASVIEAIWTGWYGPQLAC